MAQGDHPAAAEHAFDVVLRGYDRRQVDDHITALEGRLSATGRECGELRMQRDAEASRARDLESRLREGGQSPGPASTTAPAAGPAAPAPGSWSLEGLGANVESILRAAAEQAEAIHRSAEDSGRKHAEAEGRLRTTFESISERLQPMVTRLDAESSSAKAAVDAAGTDAGALEAAARQQAQAMIDAASTTAARMRAEAETRVQLSTRQVADVREELALVRQILAGLGAGSGAATAPGGRPPADGPTVDQASADRPAADSDTADSDAPTLRQPPTSAGRMPGSSGMRMPPAEAGAEPMRPAGRGAGMASAGREAAVAHDAPTETIVLPRTDSGEPARTGPGQGPARGDGPKPGHRQPPS